MSLIGSRLVLLLCVPFLVVFALGVALLVGPVMALAWVRREIDRARKTL